jgi:hypothetical protein
LYIKLFGFRFMSEFKNLDDIIIYSVR